MEITKINPLLRKRPWKRLVAADAADVPCISDAIYYDVPTGELPGLRYRYLSGADLLNESCENAHSINSAYMSKRPVYEPVEREVEVDSTDEFGNPIKTTKTTTEWVVTGYEDIETVRCGLPEFIIKTKASHLGKNGIEIANEGDSRVLFDKFRAWKDISGLDSAWLEALYACGKSGDAAVYLYAEGGTIEYSVFSLLKGDMLFPQKDADGKPMLARLYNIGGRDAVDVFTVREISTWVRGDVSESSENECAKSWWDTVRGWFGSDSLKKSEDGWTRIKRRDSQLGNNILPIVYMRFDDTPIGPAMMNVEALERSDSYCADKVKSTAYSKLFVKSAKITNMPPLSSGEEVIAVENADADMLRASSVEHISAPDMSNIFSVDRKSKMESIMLSTMTVDLSPEILKSGADSSVTMKMLLRREIQYCHVVWTQLRPAAKGLIEVMKELVAKITGNSGFRNLLISVWNTPWIPQNETEMVSNVEKMVYCGVLSQESGANELNLQYTNDREAIRREAEEKLYRTTFVPLKAQADAAKKFGESTVSAPATPASEGTDNPRKEANAPKADNRAPRKDIAE